MKGKDKRFETEIVKHKLEEDRQIECVINKQTNKIQN